ADAEEQQLCDRLAELWIDELRIKAYQIDDLLDEWSTAILKRRIEGSGAQLNSLQLWLLNVSIFFSNVCPHLPTSCFSFHDIPMRHDIARRIKGFNAELDRLAEGTKRYREIGSSSNSRSEVSSQNNRFGASRITAHVLDTAVEGRELEKSQLLEFLIGGSSSSSCSKTPNIKIVSIVGLGGFGKTTLAQLVRKELKSGSFDKSIWVCVSNSFDEIKVAKTILESLSDKKDLPDDLPKILEDLEKEVEVKNFFLVLDDVWEDSFDSWKSIMASLSGGLSGSRILVTTRKGSVAKTLSMCIHNININGNSNESSHTLELEELSMEACIKVFNFVIRKDSLIKMWMAQGYLGVAATSEVDLECIGDEYFASLTALCIFQDVQNDGKKVDSGVTCKMHDLVHDFAEFVSEREVGSIDGRGEMRSLGRTFFHLQIETSGQGILPNLVSDLKGLRTIFATENPHLSGRDKVLMVNLPTCLRSLSLTRCNLSVLPPVISQLILLRLLDLSHNSMKELPDELCELVNLQTLDLEGCGYLEKWPQGMEKLVNLRHLINLRAGWSFPEGIGGLTGLRTLSEMYLEESVSLVDLHNLNQLSGSLVISNLGTSSNHVEEAKHTKLEVKNNITKLSLGFNHGSKGFPREENWLEEEEISKKMLEALKPSENLEELEVEGLEVLKISYFKNLKEWQYEGDKNIYVKMFMPCIRTLYFEECDNLVKLPDQLLQKATLEKLKVRHCYGLHLMYDTGGKEQGKVAHIPNVFFDNVACDCGNVVPTGAASYLEQEAEFILRHVTYPSAEL
ncbi:Putative disease resistance protein RGA4, partial [Linum perenne]